MDNDNSNVLIIGAGPSGLALAYELIQLNSFLKPVIIEKLSVPGGLSRTVYDGKNGIDIGGHRLFTKDKYIEEIWKSFFQLQNTPAIDDFLAHRAVSYSKTGADPNFSDDVLLIRKRFSSIIKDNKRFSYPLRFNFKTFKNLGLLSSALALFSYFKALLFKKNPVNIENFLINRFGYFIYNLFFKEHTKKIWGIDAGKLINEWPKRRIQRSLFALPSLWEDEYYYPKFGCSQLWDKMAKYITDNGGVIYYNSEFTGFNFKEGKISSALFKYNNKTAEIPAKYFVSSIPISDLIKTFDAPYDIKQYALNLPYRDYVLVNVVANKFNVKNETKFDTVNNVTPDNWIYLQNKNSIASRLQIMNNWSPYLVDDIKNNYSISVEYFCNSGDKIREMSDDEITKLAIYECENYGFFTRYDVISTKVIRESKAYPIYCGSYKNLYRVKEYFSTFDNLFLIGRNGTHQYINMDSAMVCGINIARDINKGYKNGKQMS